jgi:hypothetical protein
LGVRGGGGPTIGSSTAQGPSFRDLVESSATNAGVAFLPHPKRGPVDGCAVFKMGGVAVYIDTGVLFVDVKGGGNYVPMGVDEALEAAIVGF